MKIPRRSRKRFGRYLERGIPLGNLQSLIPDDGDSSSALQEEHAASYQHDRELVAPVSGKTHISRLERNRNAARISREYQSDPNKRVMWALRSAAVFLELLAEAMWRWSDLLEKELE